MSKIFINPLFLEGGGTNLICLSAAKSAFSFSAFNSYSRIHELPLTQPVLNLELFELLLELFELLQIVHLAMLSRHRELFPLLRELFELRHVLIIILHAQILVLILTNLLQFLQFPQLVFLYLID